MAVEKVIKHARILHIFLVYMVMFSYIAGVGSISFVAYEKCGERSVATTWNGESKVRI